MTTPARVMLVAEERHQSLVGFGASVAWYIDALVEHPQEDEIYEQLFAELGLDILRFRNRYQRTNEQVDLAQESEILERAAQSLGRSPAVLLTSWSPPAALKANGDDDCRGEPTCTLRQVDGAFVYDEFAEYWRASLEEYRAFGIIPDFVSLQNEPDFTPRGWEGCRFAPTEAEGADPENPLPGYDLALAAVHARLGTLASPPGLLGPETLGVHYYKAAGYLEQLDRGLLAGAAHHLYEQGGDGVWDWSNPGPDSYIDPMRSVPPAAGGLPIFQTEFSTDEDEGINGGFETAWLMHNSMVEGDASAWLYWDLVWGGDGGLVSLDAEGYTVRDQYYSVRHYARFTDPGDVRVGAESNLRTVRASAYMAPDGDRVTMVVLNVGDEDESVTLELAGYAPSSGYLTVYRPGASERWQPLTPSHELALPSRSVATLVLHRPTGE